MIGLRKKSKEAIVRDFLKKYNIGLNDWERLQLILKRPSIKNLDLLWIIPILIIGLTYFLCFIGALFERELPQIFMVEDVLLVILLGILYKD